MTGPVADSLTGAVFAVARAIEAQAAAPAPYRLGRAVALFSPSGSGEDGLLVKEALFGPGLFGAALGRAALAFARDLGARAAQRHGLYQVRMLSPLGRIVGTTTLRTEQAPAADEELAAKRITLARALP